MKKKKLILLFVLIPSVVFFNCKKGSSFNYTAPQSMIDLLTQDTLQFESYIIKWQSSKADTLYKRGAIGNKWNMDSAWYKFNKDSTFKGYISQFNNYSAQWGFLENGAKLRLWNKDFDKQYQVLKLTKDTVEWLDPKTDSLFYRFIRK